MSDVDLIDDVTGKAVGEVAQYLRSLCLEVDWDFRGGVHWFEIYEGAHMIAQIDFGTTVAALKHYIPLMAARLPDMGVIDGPGYLSMRAQPDDLRRLADLITADIGK